MSKKENELLKQIEELKNEIKNLKSRKKYGLVWEEKEEQVVLDCQNKLPILKEVKSKVIMTDKNNSVNILIEGDNYHSLSVLSYTHKEKIDFIYIDPPYNTGSKDFKYNDSYVDSEDSYKHSKWTSFINKRLKLARELLNINGTIFISIDDNEVCQLKLLCDEIFGEENLEAIISWRRRTNQPNDKVKMIAKVAEFILVYSKNSKKLKENKNFNTLPLSEKRISDYSNPDNDRRGAWSTTPWCASRGQGGTRYEIKTPTGIMYNETWLGTKETFLNLLNDKRVIFPKNGNGKPRKKVFLYEREKEGQSAINFWFGQNYGDNLVASSELNDIFGGERAFDNPKPINLIKTLLKIKTNKRSIVLDFFAGSGTTGHAVLDLNKEDGGNRKFILCTNNENKIAEEVCYPRIEKIINGYKNKKNEKIIGLGGNLKYYKTNFVDTEHISKISDESKIKLTYQAGEMIALRENTLEELEKNDWWQIFTDGNKQTAIYFKEDKAKLQSLVGKLTKTNNKATLYVFSWGKNEYKNEFSDYENIRIEDIPEPILEVYKEINKL